MRLTLLLLTAAIALAEDGLRTLEPATIQARFSRLHAKNEERASELRRMFTEAGGEGSNCPESTVQGSREPNLTCTLQGSNRRTVVVSAHLDNRGPGEGAIDNWSGASLLPSLFESLNGFAHALTFQFMAFTDEERGLIGSRDYVQHLSKQQRLDILLNVNIDSVGAARPLRVWTGRSDNLLVETAAIVAGELNLPLGGAPLGRNYASDASAFTPWNIPL